MSSDFTLKIVILVCYKCSNSRPIMGKGGRWPLGSSRRWGRKSLTVSRRCIPVELTAAVVFGCQICPRVLDPVFRDKFLEEKILVDCVAMFKYSADAEYTCTQLYCYKLDGQPSGLAPSRTNDPLPSWMSLDRRCASEFLRDLQKLYTVSECEP